MATAARLVPAILAAALASLWLMAGCHWLAGDFEVGASPTSGAGGTDGGGAPDGVASCEAGDVRCQGAALQRCDPAADPPWRTVQTCPSTVTCDAQVGLCHVCNPGEHRCAGWELEACNAVGSGFDRAAQCNSSVYCDAAAGLCLTCLAGEAHCEGAALSVCNATGDGWVVTQCESADLCNERSQSCRCCAPGELQCAGTTLRECVADCAWQPVVDCATPELCTATVQRYPATSAEGWTGQCDPPACDPGTYLCAPEDGRQLLGCPPSRTGWEVFDTCDTVALCDATAGVCQTGCGPGITPGSYRCEGAELQRCSLDGTRFETIKSCAAADQCNATRQDCVVCEPGEHECSGSTLRRCTEASTWEILAECASAALCLAEEGRCESPGCVAGAYECDGTVLRRCGPDNRSWETVDYCVTDALCDAAGGHCNPPGCPQAGAVDCAGNTLRSCPSSLVAWEVLQICPDGWLCDAQGQICRGECPTPPFQCQAGVPMECREDAAGAPSWQPTGPPCTTSPLCFASEWGAWCLEPVCQVGAFQCTDGTPQVLQTCAVGRDRWDDVATCAERICDPIGAQCDVCVANQFSCSDAQLQQCGPAGQVLEARGTCRDAAHCYASGSEGYCYVCDPGDSQCSGTNQIQDCTVDRGGFGAPTTCEHGCQDDPGNADYCAGCPLAGEVACVDESRPGSTRRCPADRSDWGPTEPCAAGLGCVNDGTTDYCADTCAPNQASCVGEAGVHTCSADGEGFTPTRYECADASSQRRCVEGILSDTEVVACPATTPFCVDGGCVECTGATRECVPGTTSRRECVNGTWQLENCAVRTDGNVVCFQGDCASCNAASPATCLDDDTRRHCVEGSYTTTNCTGDTPACNPATGECAACNGSSAATCADATTRRSCATSSGTWMTTTCDVRCLVVADQAACVACDPGATPATCTAEDGVRTCSPTGAFTTTPCLEPTPACALVDGEAECVGCAADDDCLDVMVCVDGACACPSLTPERCGDQCVDTENDPSHCGACSRACVAPAGTCSNGDCVSCVADGDCPVSGQSCEAGQCSCPSGQEVCDAACVDLSSSDTHCGTCTTVCAADQHCTNSVCVCTESGLTNCDGTCVDLTSDAAHCGDCETECTTASPYCLDRACVQCQTNEDCVDPENPSCGDSHVCVPSP